VTWITCKSMIHNDLRFFPPTTKLGRQSAGVLTGFFAPCAAVRLNGVGMMAPVESFPKLPAHAEAQPSEGIKIALSRDKGTGTGPSPSVS
jgi:hypothetical protein